MKQIKTGTGIILASMLLAGCATNKTTPVVSTPTTVVNKAIKLLPSNIQSHVQDVVDYTKTVCKFVPTAATVVSLVDVSPTSMTVAAVAKTICGVVGHKHKLAHRFGDAPGTKVIKSYNGVVITGTFVN